MLSFLVIFLVFIIAPIIVVIITQELLVKYTNMERSKNIGLIVIPVFVGFLFCVSLILAFVHFSHVETTSEKIELNTNSKGQSQFTIDTSNKHPRYSFNLKNHHELNDVTVDHIYYNSSSSKSYIVVNTKTYTLWNVRYLPHKEEMNVYLNTQK